jgi:hypothetical protein
MVRRRGAAGPLAMASLGLAGCASRAGRAHDYILGVTCVVVDSDGQPVDGAEVSLRLGRLAYHAITPVHEESRTTAKGGGVVFLYTAHQASTPYTMTVRKAGYLEAEVSGLAGPATHHKITLAKIETDES